jgi:hypothetical protein
LPENWLVEFSFMWVKLQKQQLYPKKLRVKLWQTEILLRQLRKYEGREGAISVFFFLMTVKGAAFGDQNRCL